MKMGSSADLRRRFSTGRPCLDLVHTGGEGELERWELIRGPADVSWLLGVILGVPDLQADDADLAAMRPLRAAITRIAYGLAMHAEPSPAVDDGGPTESETRAEILRIASAVAGGPDSHPADVAVVNQVAARVPLVQVLRPEGGSAVVAPTVEAALATIACDAVDLFGGPLAGRVRMCAADDCGLLFVDTSRSRRRRWCSMERCGNRAKIRAFRAREHDTLVA